MADTGFQISDGTDLINIFQARTSTKIADVGYVDANGNDISNLFEPYTSGTKAAPTKYLNSLGNDLCNIFMRKSPYSFTGATQTGTATAVVLRYTTSAAANSAAQLVGTFSILNASRITNLRILMVSGGAGGGGRDGVCISWCWRRRQCCG
jgi:hypothetical protein